MDEYENQVAEENLFRARLFQYPDCQTSSAIFDFEDLENQDSFLVLCVRARPEDEHRKQDLAYVWQGSEHTI
jgi:hypothetical protein